MTHIIEIPYQPPRMIFQRFANQQGSLLLESSQLRAGCGRYSFIAVEPFEMLLCEKTQLRFDPFEKLAQMLAQFTLDPVLGLPPFQNGAAGFFSYDLVRHIETIPTAKLDDMCFPEMAVGFYDLVLGFDEEEKRAWIFSSGYPEKNTKARSHRAEKRADWMMAQLAYLPTYIFPAHPVCDKNDIYSNFTKKSYVSAVQDVIDYILAGDIFEANLSQRFQTLLPENYHPYDLYQRLMRLNPAPFSAYLNFPDTVLISASPERFIKLSDRSIETRPIKGTRPRGKTPQEDLMFANELVASEKDHAENVMIVDLLRNDLSRVCENHTVNVPQLCGLESYAAVHHLVSVVTGKLKQNITAVDVLRAAFPGGSITGAPKIRAMEIIAELEPTQRGPYCGSIGYLGFDGNMDSSVVIRTFCIKNNKITFQAGGAVVSDSIPEMEFDETLVKSTALMRALTEDMTDDFTDR